MLWTLARSPRPMLHVYVRMSIWMHVHMNDRKYFGLKKSIMKSRCYYINNE